MLKPILQAKRTCPINSNRLLRGNSEVTPNQKMFYGVYFKFSQKCILHFLLKVAYSNSLNILWKHWVRGALYRNQCRTVL